MDGTQVTNSKGKLERASLRIVGAIFSVLVSLSTTNAQQTIFNVPSIDVLNQGKVYTELDVSLKPGNSQALNHFSSLVPRVVVGAGRIIEIGKSVAGNIRPGPDSTTLVPAIKWRAFQGRDGGRSVAVGDHLWLPVNNRTYDAGNYIYAEISKTLKSGTRLTVGGFDFSRKVVAASNCAGGQLGVERPLNKRLTVASDWFTGKQNVGYFTPGVSFKVTTKVSYPASYSNGNLNASAGNHFYLFELNYNLN